MMDSMLLWGLVLGALRGEEEPLEDLLKGIEAPFNAASLVVSRIEGIRAGRDLALEDSEAWEKVATKLLTLLGVETPDPMTPRTAYSLIYAAVDGLRAERNQLQAELAERREPCVEVASLEAGRSCAGPDAPREPSGAWSVHQGPTRRRVLHHRKIAVGHVEPSPLERDVCFWVVQDPVMNNTIRTGESDTEQAAMLAVEDTANSVGIMFDKALVA